MNYEGQICRGPMERASFMLPVEVGCAYNRCKFCTLFKHLKFRELSMDQIEEELKRVSRINGNPKTVFLGDGNAFGLSTVKDRGENSFLFPRLSEYSYGCDCDRYQQEK